MPGVALFHMERYGLRLRVDLDWIFRFEEEILAADFSAADRNDSAQSFDHLRPPLIFGDFRSPPTVPGFGVIEDAPAEGKIDFITGFGSFFGLPILRFAIAFALLREKFR